MIRGTGRCTDRGRDGVSGRTGFRVSLGVSDLGLGLGLGLGFGFGLGLWLVLVLGEGMGLGLWLWLGAGLEYCLS